MGLVATSPLPFGVAQHFRIGDNISNGPQVGLVAAISLRRGGGGGGSRTLQRREQNQQCPTIEPSGYITPVHWGSLMLHSGGQNQKWPTNWPGGYITPAAYGVPNALERGTTSQVAHKWVDSIHHLCRLGGPQHFTTRGQINSGPQIGEVPTSPLPFLEFPSFRTGDKISNGPPVGTLATPHLTITLDV